MRPKHNYATPISPRGHGRRAHRRSREANNEIQRFAYIVSHDLRSPLVNIMGFTSELEELRTDIFRRIAALHVCRDAKPARDCRGAKRISRWMPETSSCVRIFPKRSSSSSHDCENGPADFGHPQLHARGTARVRAGQDRRTGTVGGDRHDGRSSGGGGRGANPYRAVAGDHQRPPRQSSRSSQT